VLRDRPSLALSVSGLIFLELLSRPPCAFLQVVEQVVKLGKTLKCFRDGMRLPWSKSFARDGSVGDSYDNALAETIIGLYKAELIHRRGPWRGLDDVEYATLEWVDWFNHRRLLEPIGNVRPVELEAVYYHSTGQLPLAA